MFVSRFPSLSTHKAWERHNEEADVGARVSLELFWQVKVTEIWHATWAEISSRSSLCSYWAMSNFIYETIAGRKGGYCFCKGAGDWWSHQLLMGLQALFLFMLRCVISFSWQTAQPSVTSYPWLCSVLKLKTEYCKTHFFCHFNPFKPFNHMVEHSLSRISKNVGGKKEKNMIKKCFYKILLPQGKKKIMQTLQNFPLVVKGLKWAQVKWWFVTSWNKFKWRWGGERKPFAQQWMSVFLQRFWSHLSCRKSCCCVWFILESFPAGTLEMEWKMEVMRGQPSAEEAHCSSALGLGSCKKNTAYSHTHLDLESYQQSRKTQYLYTQIFSLTNCFAWLFI